MFLSVYFFFSLSDSMMCLFVCVCSLIMQYDSQSQSLSQHQGLPCLFITLLIACLHIQTPARPLLVLPSFLPLSHSASVSLCCLPTCFFHYSLHLYFLAIAITFFHPSLPSVFHFNSPTFLIPSSTPLLHSLYPAFVVQHHSCNCHFTHYSQSQRRHSCTPANRDRGLPYISGEGTKDFEGGL